jgi:hypothetical protein
MAYDVGNPSPCFGQEQQYGGVQLVSGISNPLLITGSTRTIQI